MKREVNLDELKKEDEAIGALDSQLKKESGTSHIIIRKSDSSPTILVAQRFSLNDLFDMIYSLCQSNSEVAKTICAASNNAIDDAQAINN